MAIALFSKRTGERSIQEMGVSHVSLTLNDATAASGKAVLAYPVRNRMPPQHLTAYSYSDRFFSANLPVDLFLPAFPLMQGVEDEASAGAGHGEP